jgi:hypothetical protein
MYKSISNVMEVYKRIFAVLPDRMKLGAGPGLPFAVQFTTPRPSVQTCHRGDELDLARIGIATRQGRLRTGLPRLAPAGAAEAHMPDHLESLCDLVELHAVKYKIPLVRLWERVFAAIRDGKLDFGFPDEFEYEYGGRNPAPHYVKHIREQSCVNALFAIENGDAFDPWKQLWVRRMLVSAAAFDKTFPVHRKRPGAKSLVDPLADFIKNRWPGGVPPGISRKEIAKLAQGALGRVVNPKTVTEAKKRLDGKN